MKKYISDLLFSTWVRNILPVFLYWQRIRLLSLLSAVADAVYQG